VSPEDILREYVEGAGPGDVKDALTVLLNEAQSLRAEVERLSKLCCVCEGDCCRLARERLADLKKLMVAAETARQEFNDLCRTEIAGRRAAEAKVERLRELVLDVRDGLARGALGEHASDPCPCSLHTLLEIVDARRIMEEK